LIGCQGGAPSACAAAGRADIWIEIEVAMKRTSLWLAVCAMALLSGAVRADAFTIESYGNNGSSQNFTDPDETAPIQHLTDPKDSSSGLNFLGGKLNFSAGSGGAQPNGANPTFGSRNYFDPSRSPGSSWNGYSSGPFGMFGPHP
jgi:hypothetical protein